MRVLLCTLCVVTFTQAMCPSGCTCTTDQRHIVRCDDVPLGDMPSLLDPRTKTLSMSNCSLNRLDPDVMELYPDLEFLDLSQNELERLHIGIFQYQNKLRVLRLHANNLSIIQKGSFSGLSQLQLLDLSANSLKVIEPSSMHDLRRLIDLNLSDNSLTHLPSDTFIGLSKLRKLDLSYNQFARIDAATLIDVPMLEALILQNNVISEVEASSFSKQSTLRHLNLGSNQILSLTDEAFRGLNTLQYLNLSNNILRRTSSMSLRALGGSLRELDVSANNFIELNASSFEGLSMLHTLSLSRLQNLRVIRANAFAGLHNLQYVNLSFCGALETIDDGLFNSAERLRVLDLSWCKLKRIPPDLMKWSRLKSLHLLGNPLHCDCEQLSFLPELTRSLNLTDVACTSPKELSLRIIAELPSSCSTLNKSQVSLIILATLLTIAFILLFVGFFIRHRIAIWLRGGSKSNTPLYDRSLLVGSNGYDKSDQLSDTTFYSTTRRNSDRSSPPKISMRDEDEDGYYSSMLLPYDYPPQLYSTPRRFHSLAPEYCPIPPAATTIPSPPVLTDESLSNDSCNFRIISEYPVPITEL
uniref:LRRCT domain-containing protein n=1 Tax=Ascaris lumbricoides TaxID=6252 RepID=A0A0M3I2X1_ASCLU